MTDAMIPKSSLAVRWRVLMITGLLAVSAMALVVTESPKAASAATVAVGQCNSEETGAAREIRCDVAVVNNLDVATGLTSSTVTTTVCVGAPGAPICSSPLVTSSTDIVGSVNQCNSSVNSGGSTVVCNITVVTNITGVGSTSPATVNQCIGSAASGAPICAPTTAVTGADVTQCNGSGNGGTLVHFECTVMTSTVSSAWPIVINQCNSSANGGGGSVTCTAQLATVFIAPDAATATSTTAPSGTPTTTPPTGTVTTVAPGTTAPTGITVLRDRIWLPETL